VAQSIPDTDSVEVALIAATFHLINRYGDGGPKQDCKDFIEVYEVLNALVKDGAGEAHARLEKQKSG